MALVITIATIDRTSVVSTDSIRITQIADSVTFTAYLDLFDADSDISILAGSHNDAGAEEVRSDITIVDGAVTYFGGYVVNQDVQTAEDGSRHLTLQCQGYGIKLNETLVEYEEYSNKADDWIIDDLFDTYLAAFDSVTHVAQIDAGMDISFTEMTLAECMEAICQRTQGRWYIDNSKKVHYFAAEEDEVAWFLSDTPEAATENLEVNPSVETNSTGWAAVTDGDGAIARSLTQKKYGSWSLRLIATTGTENDIRNGFTFSSDTTYTVSAWFYIINAGGGTPVLFVFPNDGTFPSTALDTTKVGEWQRVAVTFTTGTVIGAGYIDAPRCAYAPAPTVYLYEDGLQIELKAAATSYCDGTRAGCTWSGAAHASTSDRIISYSYFNDPVKKVDAAAIVNRVRVIGADNFAVNRNDATSQTAYGIRAGIVTDQSLETTAAMEERGDEILDKNKDPRITYVVKTFQDGAVAGMDIGFRCPLLDIDTTQVIRELNITWWKKEPSYELALGTHADTAAISRAFYTGNSIKDVIANPTVPLASRGWGHDLVFSATDEDTVAWAGGTITTAGGVGSFAIDAGNTGNMVAKTYVYLDVAVSITVLQTTTSPDNSVGGGKIRVAVCENHAGEEASFLTGDDLLIVGDHLSVNSIKATHIVADAIETDKIKAGAVVADKLSIGQTLFSNADGLLILNPPINIQKVDPNNFWHTLRGQKASLAEGALHLVQGRWPGTKAVVVEKATVNLYANASAELDADDWECRFGTIARSDEQAKFGSYSFKCVLQPIGGGDFFQDTVDPKANPAQGETYSASFWVFGTPTSIGLTTIPRLRETGGATGTEISAGETFTIRAGWQRATVSRTIVRADRTAADAEILFAGVLGDEIVYMDGCQFEEQNVATTTAIGDMGDGYAFTGDDYNSTSTRASTEVNLDAHVGLISDNATLSFRIVAQMPYDYDATWPIAGYNYIHDTYDAGTGGRIRLVFNSNDNKFYLVLTDGVDSATLTSSVITFSAGDWIDIVVTCSFAAAAPGSYILSINGVVEDTDLTANIAAPTLTQWNLGSAFNASARGGFAFSEYAVFDRVLTAIEVAQIYNLQRPLIDTGATDLPGIYIYDGQFKIQSSQTGVRIEITPEMIAGYDGAGDEQFSLRASDGKAQCGAGEVILDRTGIIVAEVVKMDIGGIDIAITTTQQAIRAYKFELADVVMGGMYGFATNINSLALRVDIGDDTTERAVLLGLASYAKATYIASASLKAAIKTRIDFFGERFVFDGTGPVYFDKWQAKAGIGPILKLSTADGTKDFTIVDSADQVQFGFDSGGHAGSVGGSFYFGGAAYLYQWGDDLYWASDGQLILVAAPV